MAASLNIRDIGVERKRALEEEAALRGVSTAEFVRNCLDEILEKARSERAKAEWVEAARQGIEDEARYVDENGPLLAEFRPG